MLDVRAATPVAVPPGELNAGPTDFQAGVLG